MAAITQLLPTAIPGRLYGSFSHPTPAIRDVVEELDLRTIVSDDEVFDIDTP